MKKCDRSITNLLRMIKLTTAFLLLGMMVVSAEGFSQKRLTVVVTEGTLNDLFLQIQAQSDYLILYRDDVLGRARPERISLKLKNKKIDQILDRALEGTSLTYRIAGRQIALLEEGSVRTAQAQEEVSGVVRDTTGAPLPGVSVQIKGTTLGTTTDMEGHFSIPATLGDVLVVSLMGFLTEEVTLSDQDELVIQLQQDVARLEEVVVVGYGTQQRSTMTGAVTAVDAEDLNSMAASNLSNTLAGRAPGVNVTNTSGLSGASSRIRIRGSFGEPLYVIDGIVRDKAAFDALEAHEVDQMSFLKDAATASIYGSRAGNGVVLVTTRKGRAQPATFNFQSNYTMAKPTMTLLSDLTTATDELI